MDTQANTTMTTTDDHDPVTATAGIGGGKFVGIGIFCFTCLGLALLYPYNALISATDWFEYAMPQSNNIAGGLANANFIASLITTFLILAFASPKEVKRDTEGENPKAPPIRRQSSIYETFTKVVKSALGLHARIYIGLLLEALPLLVFAIIYPTHEAAIALSFIVGIGDASAQSGIFPLAGGIHPRCTAAASLGSAIAGLAAGLLRLMTKAIFGEETAEDQRISSSVYFAIAVAVLVICTLAHYAIQKNKRQFQMAFFQAEYAISTDSFMLRSDAIKRSIQAELGAELEEEEEARREAQAVEGGEEWTNTNNEEEKEENLSDVDEEQNNNYLVEGESFRDNDNRVNEGASGKVHRIFSLCMEGSLVYREAFRCAWLPIIAQFVNFFITLSLFPGVTLSMTSSSMGSWFPVILVTVFNAGDTVGRLIQLSEKVADWIVTPVGEKVVSKSGVHLGNRRPKMKYSIVLPLILRFAFYPILIFCVNPLYIASDSAQIVIVLFFSMSSGWIYTCCFMLGPELCKELKHKEATSLLLIVSTLLALGIGSSAGLAIHKAVTA